MHGPASSACERVPHDTGDDGGADGDEYKPWFIQVPAAMMATSRLDIGRAVQGVYYILLLLNCVLSVVNTWYSAGVAADYGTYLV